MNVSNVLRLVALIFVVGCVGGCAGVSPKSENGYDLSNFRKRKMVVFRNDSISAFPGLASKEFKAFEEKGVTTRIFSHKMDSTFFRVFNKKAKYAKVTIDSSTKIDSIKLVRFQNKGHEIIARVSQNIPNDSVLVLAFGGISFGVDHELKSNLSALSLPKKYLRAELDYVVYDPLISSAVAGGRLVTRSSSMLGTMITESDWYADAYDLGFNLIDEVNELRSY